MIKKLFLVLILLNPAVALAKGSSVLSYLAPAIKISELSVKDVN